MKSVTAAMAALAAAAVIAAPCAAAAALTEPGSDTCLAGFVWREARPADHVCVTPKVRERTAVEN
ncbi:hypothetical protein, partial [Nonomuraea sp. MG754425]|uniref:hypothetical protein n=1 Tax=Nonomuraea sp. MG754425 TaxID=2570319 RepID=UPI001F33D81A